MPDSVPASLISCNEFTDRGHILNYNGKKTARRSFIVIFDPAGEVPTTLEIITAAGVPDIGDAHPDDSSMVAVSVGDPVKTDSKFIYTVPVQYSNDTGQVSVLHDDPEDDPWRVDIQSEARPKVKERTAISATWLSETGPPKIVGIDANKGIANSAGSPYDPAIQESNDLEIISLTRNLKTANVDPDTIGAFRNTMNSAEIQVAGRTIPRWCGKMLNVGISGPNSRGTIGYYTITFRIGHICCGTTGAGYPKETWAHMLADVGFFYVPGGGDNNQYAIKLTGGATPVRPWPLNGAGGFSLSEKVPYVWLVFATLEEADWSTLNLPDELPDWDEAP